MNRTILSVVIIGIVIVGGFFLLRNNKAESPVVQGEEAGKKMAFTEFIKQGGPYVCTVNYFTGAIENAGTVYVEDGKVSGQFSVQYQDTPITSSFVMKDGFIYAWAPSSDIGYKVSVPSGITTTEGTVSVRGNEFAWNANQIGDYNCTESTISPTQFDLPSNVMFQEIEQKS